MESLELKSTKANENFTRDVPLKAWLIEKKNCELEDRLINITHWRTKRKREFKKWTLLQRNVENH